MIFGEGNFFIQSETLSDHAPTPNQDVDHVLFKCFVQMPDHSAVWPIRHSLSGIVAMKVQPCLPIKFLVLVLIPPSE